MDNEIVDIEQDELNEIEEQDIDLQAVNYYDYYYETIISQQKDIINNQETLISQNNDITSILDNCSLSLSCISFLLGVVISFMFFKSIFRLS